MYSELKKIIEQAWENRELLSEEPVRQAVRQVVELVDKGQLRTAEPVDPAKSEWKVNEWVKKAVILYFPIQPMRKMQAGNVEWYDKMEVKHRLRGAGRARRTARRGALRRLHRPGCDPHAVVRQHRRLCRRRARWSTRGPRSAPAPRSASTSTYRAAWASAAYWNPCRPPRSSSRTTASSARVRSWSRGRMSAARRCSGRTPSSPARRSIIDVHGAGARHATRVTCRRVRWSIPGSYRETVPRGRIQHHLRADHRPAQGVRPTKKPR